MSVFYPLPIILFCLLALVAEANSNKAIQSKEPWPEIIVSNLNADGPGSFTEALKFKGPKRVVFNVGGVIDLEKRSKSGIKANEFLGVDKYQNAIAWSDRLLERPGIQRGLQVCSWTDREKGTKPWLN